MRFGPREIVFLVVLLAVPMASFWFVFRPQNEEIMQARSEIQHKEEMLHKLTQVTSKAKDLEAMNDEIGGAISIIESRLPSAKEVDVVLTQVAELAKGHHLALVKVKSDKPVSSAGYMEQPLSMVITGGFEGFYSFLLDVERLNRITRMPSLHIERSHDEDGAMKAEFTLSIYFEPNDGGQS